jgi:HD-like signal output (HDOD) protein
MTQSIQDIRNQLLVARLPAMPQILLKLIELCEADEASMAELAKLIANDAAMTAKVLGVANSAAYHRGGNKVGLLQALNVLGSELIKTLVISESVYQTFNGFPHASGLDLRGFWKHSLTVAVLARDIAKAMNYAQPEEAYLTGLLHDVGRLALLAAALNDYVHLFVLADDAELCVLEQRTLQIHSWPTACFTTTRTRHAWRRPTR